MHCVITFWRLIHLSLTFLGGLNEVYYYTLFMQLFPQLIGAGRLNGLSTVLRIQSLMRRL